MARWIPLLLVLAGCGGGATAVVPAAPGAAPAPPESLPAAEPQLPPVEGELIGMPGTAVPGLAATWVTTGLGWLAPDEDVVFQGILRWDATLALACGIFRRGPDGNVSPILLQGQALPGTGGGRVLHPELPLEADAALLLLPADVDGGAVAHGLFAVARGGGTPTLVAALDDGVFAGAAFAPDGAVWCEVVRAGVHELWIVEPGEGPRALCAGCAPGLETDGARAVVRQDDAAWSVARDGTATPLLGAGDAAPGTQGLVTTVREAWIAEGGDVVVQARTDDPDHPDVLVRLGQEGARVVAAGGALHPARNRGDDVVFAAEVDGGAALYAAAPEGAPELLAADGDPAGDLDATLRLLPEDAVAAGPRAAFGARVDEAGAVVATGVFTRDAAGVARVLTTGAPLAALPGATIAGFLYPLREAMHVRADGRTLVHVGIREARRPEATLGALLLVR